MGLVVGGVALAVTGVGVVADVGLLQARVQPRGSLVGAAEVTGELAGEATASEVGASASVAGRGSASRAPQPPSTDARRVREAQTRSVTQTSDSLSRVVGSGAGFGFGAPLLKNHGLSLASAGEGIAGLGWPSVSGWIASEFENGKPCA